ncbi:MAG: SPOR domain-containing protein [Pseudomonadota bacterium]|jgi:hypothetical protein
MRALPATFVGLLLANGLLYAYGQGLLGGARGGGEPERLGAQLAPEKIKVVSVGTPPPAAAVSFACRSISGLAREQAERLAQQLQAADKQLKTELRQEEEPASFWVFIPPLPDRAQAERKAAELRALGVRNVLIIQEGPNRNAISLGVFRGEQGANDELAALRRRGVRSARVEARGAAGPKTIVELHGPAPGLDQLRLPAEFAAAAVGPCGGAAKTPAQ